MIPGVFVVGRVERSDPMHLHPPQGVVVAPSPGDPYPREAALDNQGLTIDTILKKALVPSMRRMGVG